MTLPQLREPPRPTATVRADELVLGDQLDIGAPDEREAPGNTPGETIAGIETDGTGLVHVFTEQHPTWALLYSPATSVRIYDQNDLDNQEVGG